MKKILEKIKDAFYGAYPLLMLIGLPCAICALFAIFCRRQEIRVILSGIEKLGGGSIIWGTIVAIGIFSLISTSACGCFLVIQKLSKVISPFWLIVLSIFLVIGLIAIAII